MKTLLAGLIGLLGVGLAPAVAGAQTAPYCAAGQTPEFAFGFADLRQALGEPMGSAVECEHTDPATGDVLQRTSSGLAVYHPATNTSTFVPSQAEGTYLALGDSLAVGVGASTPARGADALVGSELEGRGTVAHVTNLGVERETSASFARAGGQLQRALDILRDPTSDVRVVTLSLGSNDLLSLLDRPACALDNLSPECRAAARAGLVEFSASFGAILAALNDAAGQQPSLPRVLVVTSYNPFSGLGSRSTTAALVDEALLGTDGRIDCGVTDPHDARVGLNDLQTCTAVAAGIEVVDAYAAFGGRGPLLTGILGGDIHPNDLGHRALAAAILAHLA